MNHIEARALKWLAKVTGYREDEISFTNNSSPDFITPDGQGFEIKHHSPRKKAIMIYPRQWSQLKQHADCSILVFGEGCEPEAIIPIADLPLGTRTWGNIRIDCCETNKRSIPRDLYLARVKKRKAKVIEEAKEKASKVANPRG